MSGSTLIHVFNIKLRLRTVFMVSSDLTPSPLCGFNSVLFAGFRVKFGVALLSSRAWVRQYSLWSNWVEVIVSVPGCGPLCNKSLLSSPTDNKEVVTD